MPQPRTTLPPLGLAFTVWGLGAALYFTGFFHRVAPAVLTRELSVEFGLTAAALGNLSAFYFYSYVGVQIPTGMLTDRFGPRRILTAGALLAGAGGLLFGGAQALPLVALGRFMVGAGAGVAFVAMMKLSTHWFALSRFAMISGLALATGLVGAVGAGIPLRAATEAYGWRPVMVTMGAATLLLAVAIWFIVRDDPAERGYATYLDQSPAQRAAQSMIAGLRRVLKEYNVWLIVMVNGAITAPILTFAGLWGVPFLTTHYGLSTAGAAGLCSIMLIAWGIGGPIAGALSDRIKRRRPLYVIGTAIETAACAVVFLVPGLPIWVLGALIAMIGFAGGVIMIGFAYSKESAPAVLSGTTGGVTNMGNMVGGLLMQPAVGWVLDRAWDGATASGVPVYGFAAYRTGFGLMLAWLLISIVLAALTRETHCRQSS